MHSRRSFISIVMLLGLILSTGAFVAAPCQSTVCASHPIEDPATTERSWERARELTNAEYSEQTAEFYDKRPHLEVVVDLEDPSGIDPSLLPPDVAAQVTGNTKIVAYKETERRDSSSRVPGDASLCNLRPNKIECRENEDGSRDTTISNWFGGVEQFIRVQALRYDDYPGAPDLHGWEVEKQYAKWARTDSSWTVLNCYMTTYIDGEDYCTQNDATLHHGSINFSPMWYGNNTAWWSISEFSEKAYVPFHPGGYSHTRSDIYQYGSLKYDNAFTRAYWTNQ